MGVLTENYKKGKEQIPELELDLKRSNEMCEETVEFKTCVRCAQCCYSLTENDLFILPISKKDAQILRQNKIFLNLQKEKKIQIQKGEYDPLYPYDLVANGICPFLNTKMNECKIYTDRPSNCKSFTCFD